MPKTEILTKPTALDNVFGSKPKDAIFLPSAPFQVRFNCKSGQLAVSEDEFLGNSAEISVIKVARYFGDLGRTKNAEWLQVFYLGVPGCTALPPQTVCCSYIKTRSLSQFQQVITRLMASGQNPAHGIFKVGFKHHANGDRDYYSVTWDWRERSGDDELDQLDQIAAFMESSPVLADTRVAASMVCIDGMSQDEVEMLMATARQAALPAAS